jgi:hypothetical protein
MPGSFAMCGAALRVVRFDRAGPNALSSHTLCSVNFGDAFGEGGGADFNDSCRIAFVYEGRGPSLAAVVCGLVQQLLTCRGFLPCRWSPNFGSSCWMPRVGANNLRPEASGADMFAWQGPQGRQC